MFIDFLLFVLVVTSASMQNVLLPEVYQSPTFNLISCIPVVILLVRVDYWSVCRQQYYLPLPSLPEVLHVGRGSLL
jgi:hypothetical protein